MMMDLVLAKTNFRTRIKVAERGAKHRKEDLRQLRNRITQMQKEVKVINKNIRWLQKIILPSSKGLRENLKFLVKKRKFLLGELEYAEGRVRLLRNNLKQNYADKQFYINRLRHLAERAAEAADTTPDNIA